MCKYFIFEQIHATKPPPAAQVKFIFHHLNYCEKQMSTQKAGVIVITFLEKHALTDFIFLILGVDFVLERCGSAFTALVDHFPSAEADHRPTLFIHSLHTLTVSTMFTHNKM